MIDNKAFYKLSYGLYVVSSVYEGKLNAQIANTIFQITSDPAMVAVSINKQNLTHQYIQKSKLIGISVLSVETPMEEIGMFGFKSGRDTDKFAGISYKIGESGVPIVLDNVVSYFELQVEKEIDVFTHTIFIGRISNAELVKDIEQMTYQYYQNVKRGKTPKTAPTYIENKEETKNRTNNDISQYQCSVCGYIYDTSISDTKASIPEGTLFENMPDSWVCPICGAVKDKFKQTI